MPRLSDTNNPPTFLDMLNHTNRVYGTEYAAKTYGLRQTVQGTPSFHGEFEMDYTWRDMPAGSTVNFWPSIDPEKGNQFTEH